MLGWLVGVVVIVVVAAGVVVSVVVVMGDLSVVLADPVTYFLDVYDAM